MMHKSSRKGFTLIETLVAIAILMVVLTAIYTVVIQGLKSTSFVNNQTIAGFLAQDALEYVTNIRNSNMLDTEKTWLEGLEECENKECIIDTRVMDPYSSSPVAIQSCGSGGCPVLGYDEGSNQFGYGSGWPVSRFTRTVEIQNVDVGLKGTTGSSYSGSATLVIKIMVVKVVVSVEWQEGSETRQIVLEEYIYDWR